MNQLTPRIVAFCLSQEGLVREAYRDNATPPVWTWSGGITAASGLDVMQYKDHPAPIETCLRAVIDLMETKYLPIVLKSVTRDMSEAQLAVALSFQWHYGAINRAQWVKEWIAGKDDEADRDFGNWTDHGNALAREQVEERLFFHGLWPSNLLIPVYPVKKPSYKPDFTRATMLDAIPILQNIMKIDGKNNTSGASS